MKATTKTYLAELDKLRKDKAKLEASRDDILVSSKSVIDEAGLSISPFIGELCDAIKRAESLKQEMFIESLPD